MIKICLVLEDTKLEAERDNDTALWNGTSSDVLTGKKQDFSLTDDQMSAIVFLGMAGDEKPEAEALYRIAEPALKNWPIECRPIP